MAIKHSPGCQCCGGVTTCCETIEVKPLPTRTVVGGVASYSDTTWNSSYVTGISGTDNTVPANTTVTINVPIGCTDYVVDVEVLDDNGELTTSSDPGLFIKVGDCLQASNELPPVTPSSFWDGSTVSDDIQWPLIYSQHDCRTLERDSFNLTKTTITRPFYGDFYAAYRFAEVFNSAAMESRVVAYRAPPWRSDASTDKADQASTMRLPHDAGGLTVQITIQTGGSPVEIGVIKVYSGHRACTAISSLDDVPITEDCNLDLDDYPTAQNPWYTVTNPASYIVNNGATSQTANKTGPILSSGGCSDPACDYDYSASLDMSFWTGNISWVLRKAAGHAYYEYDSSDPIVGQYGIGVPAAAYSDATTADATALDGYITKVGDHSWTHSDRLIDWRAYAYAEPDLDGDNYTISHSLSVTGTCDVVASSQATIDAILDTRRDDRIYPSGGPLFLSMPSSTSAPCFGPVFCPGDPQVQHDNIGFQLGSTGRRHCRPLMPRGEFSSSYGVENFWSLSGSFVYPAASNSAAVSKDLSFTRAAYNDTTGNACYDTYSFSAIDVDVSEDATITKIPTYDESDSSGATEYQRIGGIGYEFIPTRDLHLQNLSLYIADESATFTATNGLVMLYTAINSSSYRPDYATCGCPCTASELYYDDLFTLGTSCVSYHRWMEFSDGTDTWYVKWESVYGFPLYTWTFLFRRKSDCKEIEFTGVSSSLPSTTNRVNKTATNGNSDTLSIDVLT